MKGESDAEILILHAEDDFDMIGKALRGKKPSTYGACFHAQQCAEKYMKAMLAFKDILFPFTHDLNLLNAKCLAVGIEINIEKEWLDLLSAYAVTARYDRECPSLEDAKEALAIAVAVRKFARIYLGLKK